MEEKNMIALISCFSRAYHYKNNKYRIFSDSLADKLLTEEEYINVSKNMQDGIKFFNPAFEGTNNEALRWIVDNRLSPSVLGRSIFAETMLKNAIRIGASQYLIFASGYDTFAYRQKDISHKIPVFEIDRKEIIKDKKDRANRANLDSTCVNYIECDLTNKEWINEIKQSIFNPNKISFCSLLGISYYLTKKEFENMISNISKILSNGSSVIFDYPTYDKSIQALTNEKLAKQANEEMKSKYSYKEIVEMLAEHDFFVYEHMDNNEMTNNYFDNYNILNPNNKIVAPLGVNYCLAVKKIV